MRCLLVVLLAGCDEPGQPSEPAASASHPAPAAALSVAIPNDAADLEKTIAAHTRRPPKQDRTLAADDIVAALSEGVEAGTVIGDEVAIVAALQTRLDRTARSGKRVYILFGSHHDAAGQLDAFRRVVGPLGLAPAPLSAIEQLQTSDDEALQRYLSSGKRDALEALLETQRTRNYTAWKYRYVDRIGDLLVAMHGSKRPLIGCDMPHASQTAVREQVGEAGDALRDLHCALAIERALAREPAPWVTLFWGDAHLANHRLPRFLPAVAEVWRIHLLGHRRRADVGLEAKLALKLTSPLLVPLPSADGDGQRFAMLLDGRHLAITTDRVRSTDPWAAQDANVMVLGARGKLRLVGKETTIQQPVWGIQLAPGPKAFVLERDAERIAGSFEVPMRGGVALDFNEPGVVRIVSHDRDVMVRQR